MEFQCRAFGGKDQEVKTQVMQKRNLALCCANESLRHSVITLVQTILLMDPFCISHLSLSSSFYCHLTL